MAGALGVLLAGGRGARLGRPEIKPLVTAGGATLLERAARTLAEACERCVLVADPRAELPDLGWPRVPDAHGHVGPLAGLVAGLATAPDRPAIAFAVDYPLVTAATLRALLARLDRRAVAVIPAPADRPQFLCAAYGPAAGPWLETRLLAGDRSLHAAIDGVPVARLDDAALAAAGIDPSELLNVNTPDDLAEAERRLAARRSAPA